MIKCPTTTNVKPIAMSTAKLKSVLGSTSLVGVLVIVIVKKVSSSSRGRYAMP
ncbi:MAG: hypothetical protein QW109_05135 [Sulfolobales archaeon]